METGGKTNSTTEELIEAILGEPTELSPIAYQYYKGLQNRRIVFNDEIRSDIVETVILPLLDMDNDGTGEPIEIIICSAGGSVFEGFPLCNIIDKLKTKTIITCITCAYSMAGLILMAGFNNPNVTKRCYEYSTGLIHSGSTYLSGSSHAVRDAFHFYEDFEEKVKEYILSHSKITEEEYDGIERVEWYMTADMMLGKGIVDEIM